MKHKTLIPVALLAISTYAYAQHPPGPPPDIIAVKLDKDHDHQLSAREISNAAKALLKLDEVDDGVLSEEELHPEPPEGHRRQRDVAEDDQIPPPPPPPSELMTAIDTDQDGALSKEELEGATDALLKLDADSDGTIDHDEAPSLGDPDEEHFGPPGGNGGGPPHGPPPGRRPRGER